MSRLTIILCFVYLLGQSQDQVQSGSPDSGSYRRYGIWISPSQATQVDGLMFNFWPKELGDKYKSYPVINGAEFNLCPLGLFSTFLFAFYSLSPKAHRPPADSLDGIDFSRFKKVNGLQIGLVNLEETIINGLDINAAGSLSSVTNGVTISGTMNKHYLVNGLTIGLIANHDTECNGAQIGIINICRKLHGVQLGLWNKNQKRSLPFVNWCFSRE